MVPDLDSDKPDPDQVLPDPAPVKSGSGSVLVRFKRHGHGSVQTLAPGLGQIKETKVKRHQAKSSMFLMFTLAKLKTTLISGTL